MTLLELLVVVAILTLLVTVLFPVGRGAISSSQRSKDANNLRQIGAAVHVYATDHGVLPGRVNRGIAIPHTVSSGDREKWLSTFLEDESIVPLDSPIWETPGSYGVNEAGIAYILNNTIMSEPPNFFGRRSNNPDKVSSPVPMVSLQENVDGGDDNGRLSRIWLATNADGENYGTAGTGGSIYAIPDTARTPWGGRNYVFFDGRVEFLKQDEYPSHN